ncbi:hypothetical protein RFW18_08505 [Metabacillus idriensis]|uniref:hypothetical protein n=1 Tax=Metabacillus idriensis TaxID=324768 RepID=UPI002813FB04|nr:hypothetical protein [Metabacillus idriensis]MDR0137791.1 hypothetical protein [Metabacillus idriensis]
MDKVIEEYFKQLDSKDRDVQYEAYQNILSATEGEVDWAYEVWDELLAGLCSKDNHQRSRSAQFLSSLAISDPDKRMLNDFPAVWEVTRDPKFVTARHSLQSIWKIGLAGPQQKKLVLDHLIDRFQSCSNEKNYTLIRFDIIQDLKNLYDQLNDENIKEKALELIESEEESKYQKKYKSVWKKV